MAQRDQNIPAVWADGAADVPASPVASTTYRKSSISAGDITSAWPYSQVVDSAIHNEVLGRLTYLMKELEERSVLIWSPNTEYKTGTYCLGPTNFLRYMATQDSTNENPEDETGEWILVDLRQTIETTASATSTALGLSLFHEISGTATITGFTGIAGVVYHCRAIGAFTLTHHATDLIITQGGANITVAAGDTFDVQMLTTTTARIVNYINVTGYSNTQNNTNVGAGYNVFNSFTTGTDNTVVGYAAFSNTGTTQYYATAIGKYSLRNVNNANYPTAVGYQSAEALTTGSHTTAIGYNSLRSVTTADYNTAVGGAAAELTTGSRNTAIGANALGVNTTGGYNTAVGALALDSADATGNTAVGAGAGGAVTSGGNNTIIGQAGLSLTTGSNNTIIGNSAGSSSSPSGQLTTESNRICLGDTSVTNAYIKVAWTVTSDARDKADVTDFNHGLDYISQLRPVNFVWDDRSSYENGVSDGSKKKDKIQLGFLAQEVSDVEKSLCIDNDCIVDTSNTELFGMQETKLIPVLVNAIKELQERLIKLESK